MLFSSAIFLFLFLPLVLIIYYNPIFKSRIFRNTVLLILSIGFYAWGEPVFVLVMLLSIVVNWYLGLLADKYRNTSRSRIAMIVAVVYNMGILFIFKYLTFAMENIKFYLFQDLKVIKIALPIGISFFTFQALSYVFDVYRNKGEAQRTPFNVGLYVSFFPQLIAGPIVRYETIANEIRNRKEKIEDFYLGSTRFIMGLSKKVLLANNLGVVADRTFAEVGHLSVLMSWLGILAYAFQIYFDFSGYSDMAIGLGKMFGFHFLENFNFPYIAKSISEFWRRWHISLSTWFRDYLYFPLGGSRVESKFRLVFNLFVVWLLTGIWHGANWTFVVWGLLYFVLLSIEKLTGFSKKLGWFGHVYTLFFVLLGWVIFRSDSIELALTYMAGMFGINATSLVDGMAIQYLVHYSVFYIAGFIFSMPVAKWIDEKFKGTLVWDIAFAVMVLLTLVLSISAIVNNTYNPFIYFNF
ncbi:MAG: MBOAT family protein [Eubacteriaceae bacterium]|nr:MBOAT family protein [Eubacteriaceae bacterium]